MSIAFEPLSRRVIGIAVDVHRALGPGYLESTYGRALAVAFRHRGVRFVSELPVAVCFEGVEIGVGRADMVVEEQMVLELKAVESLHEVHFAQLRAYLKASGIRVGLLLNFNAPTLVIRRMVVG